MKGALRRRPLAFCGLLVALLLLVTSAASRAAGEDEREQAGRQIARLLADPAPALPAVPVLGLLSYPTGEAPPALEACLAWSAWSGERRSRLDLADGELLHAALARVRAGWLESAEADPGVTSAAWRSLAADLVARVEVELRLDGPGGARFTSLLVVPGRRTVLADVEERAVLSDYDPELACDNSGGHRPSAVGNPVVSVVAEGVVAAVEAYPSPAGEGVVLDAVVQVGHLVTPSERLATGARFLGLLELPRYEGALVGLSGAVAFGEPLDASLETPDGRLVVRLVPRRVVPRVGDAVAEGRGSVALRWLPATLLHTPGLDVEFEAASSVRTPCVESVPVADATPAAWATESLRAALRAIAPEADAELGPDGGIWVRGPPGRLAALTEGLAALHDEQAHTTVVEVTLRAAGGVLGRGRLVARDGQTAWARVGADQAAIVDSDPEVG